ncbi:hypothetical protein FQZ97_768500 [compost metagenome]
MGKLENERPKAGQRRQQASLHQRVDGVADFLPRSTVAGSAWGCRDAQQLAQHLFAQAPLDAGDAGTEVHVHPDRAIDLEQVVRLVEESLPL